MILNFCSGVSSLETAISWGGQKVSRLFPAEISPLLDTWFKKLDTDTHTNKISVFRSPHKCHNTPLKMSIFNSTQANYMKQKKKEGGREREETLSQPFYLWESLKKEPVTGAKNTDETRHKIQKFCRMAQRNTNAVPITRWVATE